MTTMMLFGDNANRPEDEDHTERRQKQESRVLLGFMLALSWLRLLSSSSSSSDGSLQQNCTNCAISTCSHVVVVVLCASLCMLGIVKNDAPYFGTSRKGKP